MHRSCLRFYDVKTLKGLRESDVVYRELLLSIVPDPGGKQGKTQKDQCNRHKLEDFNGI